MDDHKGNITNFQISDHFKHNTIPTSCENDFLFFQRVHTLPSDGEDLQTFRCGECSCVFRKLGSLNAHISREHSEQTVCLKLFKS